jgi:hypothetical protein
MKYRLMMKDVIVDWEQPLKDNTDDEER